jgi:hypothetical protein
MDQSNFDPLHNRILLQNAARDFVRHHKQRSNRPRQKHMRAFAELDTALLNDPIARTPRQGDYRLKPKCGGPRFDPLVHHARSCDDNSVKEVSLTVTTMPCGPNTSASKRA